MGNDCRRILFGLFMASSLSGCLQGNDIETVKEGRFDDYPEFKIGETFDHRALCATTSWDLIQDDRGRDLVEYRCEIKGIHAYYTEKLAKQADQCEAALTTTYLDSHKGRYIAQREKELEKIEKLKASLGDDSYEKKVRAEHEPKMAKIKATLDVVRAKSIDQMVPLIEKLYFSVWSGDVRSYISDIETIAENRGDSSSTANQQNYYARKDFDEVKPAVIASLEKSYRYHEDEMNSRIRAHSANLEGSIRASEEEAARLTSLLEGLKAKEAKADETAKANLAKINEILNTFNVASAYEFFQWSVADDNTFMLIGGGLGLRKPQDDTHQRAPYLDARLKQAIGDAYSDSSALFEYITQRTQTGLGCQ